MPNLNDPKRQFLAELFDTAVAAADPHLILKDQLPPPPKGMMPLPPARGYC